jgi:heme oxygenase
MKAAVRRIMGATETRERRKPEAFRFVLRSTTSPEHQALDAHPAFARLMDGSLSVGGYRRLMAQFHGFYNTHDPMLELACRRHSVDRLGFAYASRTAILGRDLAALGGIVPRPAVAGPAPLHGLDTAGTLGGVLYVLEGSMLGGGVLSRAVESLLSRTGTSGGGYWLWCRDFGAARWAMTCAMIEALSASEAARSDMISGAQNAFATFAGWLADWQDEAPDGADGLRDMERC